MNSIHVTYKGNLDNVRKGQLYFYTDSSSEAPYRAYLSSHSEKGISKPLDFGASSVDDLFGIVHHGHGLHFGNTDFVFETSKRPLNGNAHLSKEFPACDYLRLVDSYLSKN